MHLPTDQVAYSIPGSYLTLQQMEGKSFASELAGQPEGLYLRIMHGVGRRLCFRLQPLVDGVPCDPEDFSLSMTPGGMTLTQGERALYLTLEDPDVLTVRGEGAGLRLDMPPVRYEYAARYGDARWLVNTSASRAQFMLTCLQGRAAIDAPYERKAAFTSTAIFCPTATARCAWPPSSLRPSGRSAPTWATRGPPWRKTRRISMLSARLFPPPAQYRATMTLSLYTLWSAIVRPQGLLRREGVLMSNNWMNCIWTWDSAINAMGLSFGAPRLALDQLLLPFDYQTPEGLLPDYVNPYDIMWNFTKPPIHAFALKHFLLERLNAGQLEDLHTKFTAQVAYWLRYADADGDGICQYNHGNDCGWDNCTPFEVGAPVEGPDLNAYLALEMETIGEICRRLKREQEADQWLARSRAMVRRLIEHSWDGQKFRVYQSGTHRQSPRGNSLYPYLPLVLGHRLPREIYDTMITDLKRPGNLLTAHGLATESIASACYEADGYWRGPVWAPIMLLMVMGIADGGDEAFARLLAERFCDTCVRGGLAENYDALTGEPLRDPSHTWTASVFIVLSCRYAGRN